MLIIATGKEVHENSLIIIYCVLTLTARFFFILKSKSNENLEQYLIFMIKNKILIIIKKNSEIRSNHSILWTLWQYRLWSFQGRDTKSESFLAENQHIKVI